MQKLRLSGVRESSAQGHPTGPQAFPKERLIGTQLCLLLDSSHTAPSHHYGGHGQPKLKHLAAGLDGKRLLSLG